MPPRELRPHQVKAMDGIRQSIREGKRRPILQIPTGGGKTVCAAHIVHGAHTKGNRVTFCVPSLGLIGQTFDRFVENGIDPADMGIIQADHPWKRPAAPIQIATAQTLARRDFPICDFVIIDEAHVMFDVYQKWMDDPAMAGKIFIGLTATPWAKGMGQRFDNLIKPTSLERLIGEGYASPFRVFAPSHPDLTGVHTLAGDYHEAELGDAMSKPKLVADIVETWLAKGERRPTLCFCVNRAHAQRVHDLFQQNGVRSAYIDAFTPREDREAIGRAMKTGEIEVACNIGTLTVGIDWDVRCLILARPTKSEMLFVQIIGRSLRTAEGKDYALLLDHSDTHQRLGMVTDIDHETLDDGRGKGDADEGEEKPKKEIALPYECKSCQCLVPPKSLECPACGTVARRAVHIKQEAGELVEMGSERAKRQKDPPIHQQLQNEGKDAIMGQLRYVASERGRSEGWAAQKFREIFEVWPNHYKNSLLRAPSAMLLGWLRSRDIAYARAKQSERARG